MFIVVLIESFVNRQSNDYIVSTKYNKPDKIVVKYEMLFNSNIYIYMNV